MLENKNLTNLNEYGEFGLIDLLTKDIKLKNKSSVLGVGDDAAIIDSGDRLQVVSTDLLNRIVIVDFVRNVVVVGDVELQVFPDGGVGVGAVLAVRH